MTGVAFLCAVVALLSLADYISAGLAVHDVAAQFAAGLRAIQISARDQHRSLTVVALPPAADRESSYQVYLRSQLVEEHEFPRGIYVTGRVTFDAQGAPLKPAKFVFRKNDRIHRVDVDPEGIVSMPP